MTWTRLDDTFTDDQRLADLDHTDRWHYLAMIQFCSRTQKYDGILRAADARRCSDHPDPNGALFRITGAGLITKLDAGYRINQIDDHIPPPSVRQSSERARIRKQRERRHKEGDHSMCLPENCAGAPPGGGGGPGGGVTPHVTRDVTSDTGTGQDRTGQDKGDSSTGVSSDEIPFDSSTGEVLDDLSEADAEFDEHLDTEGGVSDEEEAPDLDREQWFAQFRAVS